MPFDLAAIQSQLAAAGLDAWLLTDFRGSNAPARRILGVPSCSRRWWYLIPRTGTPLKLEPSVEEGVLGSLPGPAVPISKVEQTDLTLAKAIAATAAKRIAMEYSPLGHNPYVAHVDAGTIERVRALGVEVISSQDLLQFFDARWTGDQWESHLVASNALTESFRMAAEAISASASSGRPLTEFEVSSRCQAFLKSRGMAVGGLNTSDTAHSRLPHYDPPEHGSAPLTPGSLVLMDHYCKLDRPDAVFADYTRVFYLGKTPPAEMTRAFDTIVAAREAVVAEVERATRAGRPMQGRDLDLIARKTIIDAGYEPFISHRTGHNLGASHVHGNGAHLDAVEHPDSRTLLPSTAFTIEPGLYFPTFGVRTEINAYLDPAYKLHLTGHRPDHIETLDV